MDLRNNKRHNKPIRGEFEELGIGFDYESVADIILDLNYLLDNRIYIELFNVFKNWEDPLNVSVRTHKELQFISPLLAQVVSNKLTPENSNIFSSYIDYYSFYHFYRFLEWIYSMNLGRNLNEEDAKAIFSSNIVEKIILELENFDPILSTHNLDDSFFHDIKEAKWIGRHTEKFFDKLQDLIMDKSFKDVGNREISFKRELKRTVKFLAVCCAVNKGRQYITTIEVISAYKVLFKIIMTDITPMINKKEYKGLLICPMCNGYYSLQEDEIPDDFIRCGCGGDLVYIPSLDGMEYYIGNIKKLMIDEKGLIAGVMISLTFALLFNNIFLTALISGIVTVLMANDYTDGFKYSFLTGNIFGSLLFIAVFIFEIMITGINLNQHSPIDGSTIFIFTLILGVLAIYCGRIWTFITNKSKSSIIIPT